MGPPYGEASHPPPRLTKMFKSVRFSIENLPFGAVSLNHSKSPNQVAKSSRCIVCRLSRVLSYVFLISNKFLVTEMRLGLEVAVVASPNKDPKQIQAVYDHHAQVEQCVRESATGPERYLRMLILSRKPKHTIKHHAFSPRFSQG